jgi:hypothetical protein
MDDVQINGDMDGIKITLEELDTGKIHTRVLLRDDYFLVLTGNYYLFSSKTEEETGETRLVLKKWK